jgi:hypothetical protein
VSVGMMEHVGIGHFGVEQDAVRLAEHIAARA